MDDKIKKIWYLIIIILVCLSAIFYIFRSNLSKKIQPVETPEMQETITSEPEQDVETKQEKVEVKKDTKKEVSIQKKQEVKKTISNANKQVKIVETKTKTEVTPKQEEKAIQEMQQIQETAQPSNRSEVVEIRYMYKTNLNNNVYYRGVWYNIKTKTLEKNNNEVKTETKTETEVKTETESKE